MVLMVEMVVLAEAGVLITIVLRVNILTYLILDLQDTVMMVDTGVIILVVIWQAAAVALVQLEKLVILQILVEMVVTEFNSVFLDQLHIMQVVALVVCTPPAPAGRRQKAALEVAEMDLREKLKLGRPILEVELELEKELVHFLEMVKAVAQV
jgi:hypothetical protein